MKNILCVLICFPFLAYSGEKIVSQSNISANQAKYLGEMAIEAAKEMDRVITVGISDADGFLVYLQTMDGAKRATVRNAADKSHTAALKRRNSAGPNSKPVPKGQLSPDSPYIGRLVVMRGGVPIFHDDMVVGAIGVSGATGEEDEQIALAALKKSGLAN